MKRFALHLLFCALVLASCLSLSYALHDLLPLSTHYDFGPEFGLALAAFLVTACYAARLFQRLR